MKKMMSINNSYIKFLVLLLAISLLNACHTDDTLDENALNFENVKENKELKAIKLPKDDNMVLTMNARLYSGDDNSRVAQQLQESTINWD